MSQWKEANDQAKFTKRAEMKVEVTENEVYEDKLPTDSTRISIPREPGSVKWTFEPITKHVIGNPTTFFHGRDYSIDESSQVAEFSTPIQRCPRTEWTDSPSG